MKLTSSAIGKFFLLTTGIIATLILVFYSFLAFTFRSPDPDFTTDQTYRPVIWEEVKTNHTLQHSFRAQVRHTISDLQHDFYSGFRLQFNNSAAVDSIRIGITSDKICRYEVWKNRRIIEQYACGCSGKFKWNKPTTLDLERKIDYRKGTDQLNLIHCQNTPFFGSIGSITLDLKPYNLRQFHHLSVFELNSQGSVLNSEVYSQLQFWKNLQRPD
jgi:hypothetical protein